MTPKFELGREFCTMHLPQVSSSYVYSFGSYRVDKQTNKQTPLKISDALRYATTLGNKRTAAESCMQLDHAGDRCLNWAFNVDIAVGCERYLAM